MFRDLHVGVTTIVRNRNSFILVVHNAPEISDREWDQCSGCQAKLAHDLGTVRILVVPAPGGTSLTAKQRALLRNRLPTAGVRTALLTPSATTRAVLVALAWFMPNIKGFAPHHLSGALDYLDVDTMPAEIEAEVSKARARILSANAEATSGFL